MGVDFFLRGALEPVRTREGFQASSNNLGASLQNQKPWFMVTNTDDELVLIHVPHVTHIVQNSEQEE